MMATTAALLERRSYVDGRGYYMVKEVWDGKHPECPILVFDMTVWPWVRRRDVTTIEHTRRTDAAGNFISDRE
jgi:hypothetical protein